jgi:predicted DNA-binding transcriptional regulator AlpA
MEKLLTIRMVSETLHRHENTIYRWVEEGIFPHASRIRGGLFIPESDVRRLLKDGRVRAADPQAD